jgi:carbonic anhydrase
MTAALQALARLREGNARFVAHRSTASSVLHPERRAELVAGQAPFAIVLGCSDSRVPAELIFDQGFGDLFVIRVAGNIVAPSQIGSVEFAASRFGTRLVVVMGHSQCGAVLATLEEILGQPSTQSRNLRSIVDRIRPAIEIMLSGRGGADPESVMRDAVRANVLAAVSHLTHGSALLEELVTHDGLLVVGAEYSLESGIVTFLEGTPTGLRSPARGTGETSG